MQDERSSVLFSSSSSSYIVWPRARPCRPLATLSCARLGSTYVKLGQFIASDPESAVFQSVSWSSAFVRSSPTLFPEAYVREFQSGSKKLPKASNCAQKDETSGGVWTARSPPASRPSGAANAAIGTSKRPFARPPRRTLEADLGRPGSSSDSSGTASLQISAF